MKSAFDYTLAHGFDWAGSDPSGWLISEKLRGCRVRWDGAALWTRYGNRVKAPDSFTASLPLGFPIDAEIWAGRCEVETVARLATQFGGKHFTQAVRCVAFDAPDASGGWAERMAAIPASMERVAFTVCEDREHLLAMLAEVQSEGGEGLVIRQPDAPYQRGRNPEILKVKKPIA